MKLTSVGPRLPLGSHGTPVLALSAGQEGRFLFTGVRPGRYVLHARSIATSDANQTIGLWAQTSVEVADTDVQGLVLNLQPTRTIAGVLKTVGSLPPTAYSQIRVGAYSLADLPETALQSAASFRGAMLASANVRPDGTFAVPGIAGGPHQIAISGLPGGWFLSTVSSGGVSAPDGIIDLATSPPSLLLLTVAPAIPSIKGHVRGLASGSDHFVVAFPKDIGRRSVSRLTAVVPMTGTGAYEVGPMPAGEYLVGLIGGAPDLPLSIEFLRALEQASVRADVEPGLTTSLDIHVRLP